MAATANKRVPYRLGILPALVALGGVSPASALDWTVSPSVGAKAIYTDNVRQSSSNTEDALILGVTPGVSLTSKGSRRVQAALRYGLSAVKRFGGDDDGDLYHNLNATGKAELVEDFLFIDGNARVSQELISLLGSPADPSVNGGNLATVGSYTISPYIKKRLGSFANAEMRYRLTGAIFSNDAANDVNSSTFSASLKSGSRFNTVFWGLDYFLRDATVRGGDDAQFEHVDATLGYRLSPRFRVFGKVGYDSNDYAATPGVDLSGRSWSAGAGWTPNRRTQVEASLGDSYFGRTYGLDLGYRTRHSTWTAKYQEGVSDIAQQLLNTQPYYFWQCDGGLFVGTLLTPPSGQTNCVILGVAPTGSIPLGTANGVYVSKTLRGGAAWSKGKSSLGLNLFTTRRQYQQLVGLPEDRVMGLTANYAYRLQPLTTLNALLGYTHTRSAAGLNTPTTRDDDLYTVSVGVSHRFDPKLTGALTLRHQQRNSNEPTADFTENTLTATVNMRF